MKDSSSSCYQRRQSSSSSFRAAAVLCCVLLSSQQPSLFAFGFTTTSSHAPLSATLRRLNDNSKGTIAFSSTSSSSRRVDNTAPSSLHVLHAMLPTTRDDNDDNNDDVTDEKERGNVGRQLERALRKDDVAQAVRLLEEHNSDTNDLVIINDKQWQAIFDALERTTAAAQNDDNDNNVQKQQQAPAALTTAAAAEFPTASRARTDLTNMYQTLQRRGALSLFGATPVERPLAAGRQVAPPALLENVARVPLSALTPQPSWNGGLRSGIALAVVEAAAILATGWSPNALFAATLGVAAADRLLVNGAASESLARLLDPGIAEKVARHEAGHLLVAYLLGCPVEGVVLSAWAALRDSRFGVNGGRSSVSAGTSFFDPQLSRQMNSGGADGGGTGVATVTRSAVDRYSIVVMAGIAAEAIHYGQADGGAGDEMALIAFLSQLNMNQQRGGRGGRGAGAPAWNPEAIRNQARWGALQAVLMLRYYKPAYDALVEVLLKSDRPTLGECIGAIESAARQHSLLPPSQPLGVISGSQGEAVWTPMVETAKDGVDPWSTAPHSGTNNASMESSTKKVVTTTAGAAPAPVESEEEQLATLRGYRATVEERLRRVEQRLQEINKE